MANPHDGEEIGYGKPPREHQFKPGQSGNPKGRPKAARGFKTIVEETLNAKVTMTENGKNRRISVTEASLRRLAQKALSGDQRALERVILLAQQYVQIAGEVPAIGREDHAIIADFKRRAIEGGEP